MTCDAFGSHRSTRKLIWEAEFIATLPLVTSVGPRCQVPHQLFSFIEDHGGAHQAGVVG
jgi:hypothetical protein